MFSMYGVLFIEDRWVFPVLSGLSLKNRLSHSVMSHSLQSHGLEPSRLLCPWNFSSKNTGEGCHFLLQGPSWPRDQNCSSCISFIGRWILYHYHHLGNPKSMCACAKSCPTLCDPWTVTPQALLSMEFPRQEYCSGLTFPTPGDLPT